MKLGLKDLFKDLTWMQVGAGALAAATSLFLASSIGIAGSIIGAAVGSIVTTVSSALYKSFLTASNDAIKEKIVGPASPEEDPANPDDTTVAGNHFAPANEPSRASSTTVIPSAPEATSVLPANRGNATQVLDATQAMPSLQTPAPTPSHGTQEAARVKELARLRKKARTEKLVVIVSLITGLIAVLGCAFVVYTATNGAGLGYRPEPAVSRTPTPDPTSEQPSDVEASTATTPVEPADDAQPATPAAPKPSEDAGNTTVTTPAPQEPVAPEPAPDTTPDATTGTDTGTEVPDEGAPSPSEPPTAETPADPVPDDSATTQPDQTTTSDSAASNSQG